MGNYGSPPNVAKTKDTILFHAPQQESIALENYRMWILQFPGSGVGCLAILYFPVNIFENFGPTFLFVGYRRPIVASLERSLPQRG